MITYLISTDGRNAPFAYLVPHMRKWRWIDEIRFKDGNAKPRNTKGNRFIKVQGLISETLTNEQVEALFDKASYDSSTDEWYINAEEI